LKGAVNSSQSIVNQMHQVDSRIKLLVAILIRNKGYIIKNWENDLVVRSNQLSIDIPEIFKRIMEVFHQGINMSSRHHFCLLKAHSTR
jgi:hypothetical protein